MTLPHQEISDRLEIEQLLSATATRSTNATGTYTAPSTPGTR
jgi:hypothetical protein